ncbi:MAG: ABC transporter ATP-binding protein [Anaerolineae bacterium]|nr:ABC transporter ATP-binding protein [Anaerolineae bacterium]MDW8098361.1 ABC transporter ATP-binding protein [Anaerolineae bacterium]
MLRSPYAIETQELTKRFLMPKALGMLARQPFARREILAVDRVTLQVRPGELFGLLGPNGAGKTTLIKLLCTLILPTAGNARIFGYDLSDGDQIRRFIGLATGDERSFFWRLSGRENLLFFAALYGLSGREARARVDEVMRQLELTEEADRRFDGYSSGQRQRLAIARALLHRPRVLFLDEPTRSLDPMATRHLHELILNELLRREGMTIFLTTHRLDEAERLCSRVAIMHRGRVRACGTVEELRATLRPVTRYRVRTSALPAGWMQTWRPEWGRLEERLAGDGRQELVLDSASGEEALARLIAHVTGMGGMVYAVTEERPSLEQVFQRFTAEDGTGA